MSIAVHHRARVQHLRGWFEVDASSTVMLSTARAVKMCGLAPCSERSAARFLRSIRDHDPLPGSRAAEKGRR